LRTIASRPTEGLAACAWLLWPAWVWAAGEAQRGMNPSEVPLWTWAAVLGASLLGFLIASAEDLFGWLDDRQARQLGKLVARFAGSVAAGLIAYLMAKVAGVFEIAALIGVTPAAYAGEAYIRKLAEKKTETDTGRVK
jgi:hypothetical protein